ncbi:hypothetical protein [Novosphingobium album (ex Liu et al. 2023)]|uniref:DUF2946 domain-containing protein n=1 Tax=Novosphingobium album (ex Liu et al. 2023) TaxID=3031130 RepID=A0ABT5WJC0_9SPHN|nr:hypothetical protein [Novosphingobium album (ex Liu et al. 2023)]MDE8650140.1 hypothetical protein [Novosphingobium album (ex Liu et al. 2023)]
MEAFRAFLLRHRVAAILLAMAALCLKAVVPANYMVSQTSRTITVALCQDASGGVGYHQLVIPIDTKSDHPAAKGECPFTALSMASLGGADPVLLALALGFILLLGFAPVRAWPARRRAYLRPPLRGPPATA